MWSKGKTKGKRGKGERDERIDEGNHAKEKLRVREREEKEGGRDEEGMGFD